MTEEESPQEEQAPLTVGQTLANAREDRGFDRQTVADQLHLRPGIIAAIEENNHEALPGELFLKGYVRSYARLLGLDEEALLESLEGELAPLRQAEEEQKEPDPVEVIRERRERRRRMGALSALAIAVVLIAWLVYAFGPFVAEQATDLVEGIDETQPEEPAEPDATEPGATDDDAPAVDDEPADAVEPEEPEPVEEPQAQEGPALDVPVATVSAPSPEQAPEEEETVVTETTEVEPAADLVQVSLSMDFDDECWVEVVNGAGERVIVQLATPGERIEYEGPGPLEILLGNVQAVTDISFMGESVDLSDYPAPAGRAQFVLEAETG